MTENTDGGDTSWESYRRFVISELRRGIENDAKMVTALNEIKSFIAAGDTDRIRMAGVLKEVSDDQKAQLNILNTQQEVVNSMKTKWAIVGIAGLVFLFILEHIVLPILLPGLHR